MSAVKFEIKSRFTGAVLFSLETESLKICVEAAVKARAYLGGADLSGANLRGADGQKLTLVGCRPHLALGPLGSRNDTLQAYLTDAGVYVRAGCFWDTLDKFRAAVSETHGGGGHAQEYHAAIALIETHAQHWTPAVAEPQVAA